MLVVDLADEFGLTTNEALEVCDRAGIHAPGGGASVSEADAERFRAAMAEPPEAEAALAPAPLVPDEWLQPGAIPGDTSPLPGTVVAPVRKPTKRRKYKKVKMGRARTSGGDDLTTGLLALLLSPLPLIGLNITHWAAALFTVPTIYLARSKGKSPLGSLLAMLGVVITVGLCAFTFLYVSMWNAGQTDRSPNEALNGVANDVGNFRPQMPSIPPLPTTAPDPAPAPTMAPTVVQGPVPLADIVAGNCVSSTLVEPGYVLHEVLLVDCTTPHEAQVLTVMDTPLVQAAAPGVFPADGSRPTEAAFEAAGVKACAAEVTRLLGLKLETSDLGVVLKLPSDQEWGRGTHTVMCGVGAKTGLLAGPLGG